MHVSDFIQIEEGRQAAIARVLGIKTQTVGAWRRRTKKIPVNRCPALEFATDGAVPCEESRPDITWVRVKDPDRLWKCHPKGKPLADFMPDAYAGQVV